MRAIKKYITFFFFLTLHTVYAHKDKIIQKTYGNIYVVTIASDYVEEVNKTLIIAQYSEILAKRYSYSDKIYLYFTEEQSNNTTINTWLPKAGDNSDNVDGLNIMFRMREFDIRGCLNIIETSLQNKTKLSKLKNKLPEIYISSSSEIVLDILKIKIYRPNVVKELERYESFNYYYQNNYCHFIERKEAVEKEILTLDKIVDFYILKSDLVVIFTKTDELKIITPKSEIKTLKIDNVDSFYRPLKVGILGNNKILFEFSFRSENSNRVMLYLIDADIFIQDIDKLINKPKE